MADTITTTKTLKIETAFVDGDTRTITLKNPVNDNETIQDGLAALNTYIQTNNLLIGDKFGGTFGKITSASRVTKTVTEFDI